MNDEFIITHRGIKVYKSPITFSDNEEYLVAVGSVVKTVTKVHDGDWKTAIVKRHPSIPSDTELIVTDILLNFYGLWIMVTYNGLLYYLNPKDLKYVKMEY